MNNWLKTRLMTVSISLCAVIVAFFTQFNAQEKVQDKCSYLDPILIDILAFLAAIFLAIEGIYKIVKEKNKPLKSQFTRAIRVAFGFAIMTLHIMQFMHK